jgi:hypothetical protein
MTMLSGTPSSHRMIGTVASSFSLGPPQNQCRGSTMVPLEALFESARVIADLADAARL